VPGFSVWVAKSSGQSQRLPVAASRLAGRFGKVGAGVKASHNIVVAFALLSCLGFMAYGFVGLGKFMEIFIPWNDIKQFVPFDVSPAYVPHFYGIVFTLFAMFYSILGGMHSIVWGDVIKYIIMVVACISIAIVAMIKLQGRAVHVPAGWESPFFRWKLNLDWSNIVADANKKIKDDGFSLFGLFFMMMLFKGIFASVAGPAPNYDMQKILSTRSPQEASKMSGFVSIILLPVRYSMIIGLTVLALLYFNEINGDLQTPNGTDFEKILPAAVNNSPVGSIWIHVFQVHVIYQISLRSI
jgi:Na+/proline symporter